MANRTDRHGNSLDPIVVHCGECGQQARAVTGEELRDRRTDLAAKRFYQCTACDAHVGCHDGTWQPFGTPALEHTRMMRRKAHGHFDPIWKKIRESDQKLRADDPRRQKDARTRGYEWLSKQLGVPVERCHIGMMNAHQAGLVVELCGPHLHRMGVKPERQR